MSDEQTIKCCPSCGGDAIYNMPNALEIWSCSVRGCEMDGPIDDEDGAKWNALSGPGRSAWQPIDDVPHGTYILIGWAGQTESFVARYDGSEWTDDHGIPYVTPTHWQPLPDGPKQEGTSDD